MVKIVITGAAGFIGSCLVHHFAASERFEIIEVDDFSSTEKGNNFNPYSFYQRIERSSFLPWFEDHYNEVDFVIHMGARTNTAERNLAILEELNLRYSQHLWNLCSQHSIPLIYASSAATYGSGEHGYSDNHSNIAKLQPLNPYGQSKQDFDCWVLTQDQCPPFWAGLKFFNVYGPNEYHKGRMASVVYHAFHQIRNSGSMKLFRSHRPGIADGYQSRDFIYVKDILKVIAFLMHEKKHPGIYNLGSGVANPFYSLATATFDALGLPHTIEFIDTPEDIRASYQYFTCADMSKIRTIGYHEEFFPLEEGIRDYVQHYLMKGAYL
ncbi:MAG: ADP-glyceromanno-heptose 6-epimerase [Flavobacteriia bacterium]|nr:ADP-glyceromanno-heptose 6-epimerase [Flavobacteriia bacterium]NBX39223.1 ADP-glyceromanno-heptose 6-epimerase [Flavobacteriia bacterium]